VVESLNEADDDIVVDGELDGVLVTDRVAEVLGEDVTLALPLVLADVESDILYVDVCVVDGVVFSQTNVPAAC